MSYNIIRSALFSCRPLIRRALLGKGNIHGACYEYNPSKNGNNTPPPEHQDVKQDKVQLDDELRGILSELYNDFDVSPPPKLKEPNKTTENSSEPEKAASSGDANGGTPLGKVVETLKQERGIKDICVIRIPTDNGGNSYADAIIVATCIQVSQRYHAALKERLRVFYKRAFDSPSPVMVGEQGWTVIDMDNLKVHLMSPETREKYDIEGLWCAGSEYDIHTHLQNDESINEQRMSLLFERAHTHNEPDNVHSPT